MDTSTNILDIMSLFYPTTTTTTTTTPPQQIIPTEMPQNSTSKRTYSDTVHKISTKPHPYLPNRRHTISTPATNTTTTTIVIPAINQDGSFKQCTNCKIAETPSWRRHPQTQELLCNACGLYLRLHRKPRPIALDESGNPQVIRKNAAVRRDPINIPDERRLPAQINGSQLGLSLEPAAMISPMPYYPAMYSNPQAFSASQQPVSMPINGMPASQQQPPAPMPIDEVLQLTFFDSPSNE